jgi:16S rRNA (adenine1518-N6/adenine1519-N6)-dimethyltransferase
MPNKSLGQHWLFDSKSLGEICDAAELERTDTVLEIGPGLGPLTTELVTRVKKVIAVELDHDLADALPSRVGAKNLTVWQGSILNYDFSKLPKQYKVVANIPYYLTSKVVRLLLELPQPPATAVLLVQKEVAQRLAADPGDMSILGISAQFYANVTLGSIVTADKFDPPPKVDSQVVVLQTRSKPLFPDVDKKLFFRVVKAGFGEKRKMLRSSLSGGLHISKAEAEALLAKAKVPHTARAEELTLQNWHALTKIMSH